MRYATYLAPAGDATVEVAITRFAGQTGGVLANVNRWRGQMGLTPVAEGDLAALIERFEHAGFAGYLLRVRGEAQHMLAAGVYEADHDRTWFLRATASPGLIDAIEADFFAMARSLGAPPAP